MSKELSNRSSELEKMTHGKSNDLKVDDGKN